MVKRLQSLEMQGYKTFATTTRLEFPGQITAIVGPNGSGKSNIADSVRWVLGEQSYSLLRAKRTEDMIFSGSQERPRAGMASATIVFNNEDNWLPIDYSEVAISHRAYRDGQNEYLLNGQKVRLKDIAELLSQTGLSERTYTIIGQGLVDVALALRPDERRTLFEEAAGIGLYRSRKEEALRRLENTHKNLERIRDILTEIRPRLRSLERQSQRFIEYQQLRSDLKVLLQEWYGYHWYQKQQDLRNARNAFQDQEKRLNTLRRKHAEAERKVTKAQQRLQNNRSAYEAAHSELADSHHRLEKVSRELAILDERRNAYIHQKNNLEIDIAHSEEEVKELENQKQQYEEEINLRQTEFKAASDKLESIKNKLSEVSSKKAEEENNLKAVREKRIDLQTEKVQLSAHLDDFRNRLDALDLEKSKIEKALDTLNSEAEEKQKRIDLISEEIQAKEKETTKIGEDIKERTEYIEKIENEHQDIERKIAKSETELAKSQAQLEVLIQAEAALSGYSEGSKAIVEESRKGHLPKGIEPLSKYLYIEEEYEDAIGAALGEFSDLLIIPSGGKAIVIEYLESKENERVALVDREQSISTRRNTDISGRNGFIGYANDLIKVDAEYRDITDALFSNILVVKDKQSAIGIQPKLEGSQKAVTLQGLVFQANGIMISGYNASGKKIGRTRRQSEMRDEITKLRETIRDLIEKRKSNTNTLSKLRQELNSRQQQRLDVENDLNDVKQAHQKEKDTLVRILEQSRWHNDRIAKINETAKETHAKFQSGETRLEEINLKIKDLLSEEKQLLQSVNDYPIFEIQQAFNQSQTHHIVTENALQASKQRYQDHQKRFEDAHKRLMTYQSRLTEINSELFGIKKTEAELKLEVDRINKAIGDIESDRIAPLKSGGENAEKTVSALAKLTEHSHQQVIIAERQLTQLQLELERRNDHLERLQERIEDDFGLVSYDYEQKIDGRTPLPFDNGFVESLPRVQELTDDIEDDIKRLKTHIRRIGSVNPEAQEEYFEVKDRYEFLTEQIKDLEKASEDLETVIDELDTLMERDFIKTFKAVNKEFSIYFTRLFNGGEAKLLFSDEEQPVEGGVDIEARLPGRRRQGLALLSGGERSLTAVALIFALLKVSPTPFCILDEVDAMLDESNVGRFITLLQELSQKTQFVIITHNRNTVQAADVIYGVTMGRDSTSQMISLKLEEVDETYLE